MIITPSVGLSHLTATPDKVDNNGGFSDLSEKERENVEESILKMLSYLDTKILEKYVTFLEQKAKELKPKENFALKRSSEISEKEHSNIVSTSGAIVSTEISKQEEKIKKNIALENLSLVSNKRTPFVNKPCLVGSAAGVGVGMGIDYVLKASIQLMVTDPFVAEIGAKIGSGFIGFYVGLKVKDLASKNLSLT
jgi:hypothetical protein